MTNAKNAYFFLTTKEIVKASFALEGAILINFLNEDEAQFITEFVKDSILFGEEITIQKIKQELQKYKKAPTKKH